MRQRPDQGRFGRQTPLAPGTICVGVQTTQQIVFLPHWLPPPLAADVEHLSLSVENPYVAHVLASVLVPQLGSQVPQYCPLLQGRPWRTLQVPPSQNASVAEPQQSLSFEQGPEPKGLQGGGWAMHCPLVQVEPAGHCGHVSTPPQPSACVPHCFVHFCSGVHGGCGGKHVDMSAEQMWPAEHVPQLIVPPQPSLTLPHT